MATEHDRTWPYRSPTAQYTALPFQFQFQTQQKQQQKPQQNEFEFQFHKHRFSKSSYHTTTRGHARPYPNSSSSTYTSHDFSALPYDVLHKITSTFTLPNLQSASLVCRAWRDALQPLREAMLFLVWGKRFKHGRHGVNPNLDKALECFLQGAARGSTLAMVDAGLVYWQMGNKDEGIKLYRRAAELGDPAGQCNLGISYLKDEPSKLKEAFTWLYRAAAAGHVRAQYQLALCFHQGRGVYRNLPEAARWYLTAAEGGYVRAMYNASLCFSFGEGLVQSHRQARKWMKQAADHGHSKAQFEHGLLLFSEGAMMKAVVYLELATRAGERAAVHVKNAILQQLPGPYQERAMLLAGSWRPLSSSH